VHLGAILPNYGPTASLDAIRATAEAAEELGFDSVWATEHVVVGPDPAADPYRTVFDPFATLSWIAGWTERIELGTSISIVPLHNPLHLAKQVASTQVLSGRTFRLGVGAGWYEDEFRFMGVEFAGRGRRMDEGLRLMRALWGGHREFDGEFWQFADVSFAPLPERPPEIWIGGVSAPSVRRTVAGLGDVWHPSSNADPAYVRQVMAEHPGLRLVPRTGPDKIEAMLELGAEGAIVQFPDVESMRESMRLVAARYR
jgi:probable F420-dependent oxidoreductase